MEMKHTANVANIFKSESNKSERNETERNGMVRKGMEWNGNKKNDRNMTLTTKQNVLKM